MRGEGKPLVGPREVLLCYRSSSITAARAGTGHSTHRLIFVPHSEKQNHHSVKAALLCFFFISDENKSISVSFDLPHFLTDTFRMLTSIWVWWVPIPQQGPKIPWGIASIEVQPAAEKQSKDGMCPQPPAFPRPSPPVAVRASGCRVTDAQVRGRPSPGGTLGSCPPAAGIAGPKLLAGVVALQSCLLLPPCPAATAAQLPPLLFVNH